MTERELYMEARAIFTCCLFWAALVLPAIWLLEWLIARGARLTPKAIFTFCLFWVALAFPAIWLLEWLFA